MSNLLHLNENWIWIQVYHAIEPLGFNFTFRAKIYDMKWIDQ